MKPISITSEPVSLEEIKSYCKIDIDIDDAMMLNLYLPAAREVAELETGLSLALATYRLVFDTFPSIIEIPNPPLVSVQSIQYYNSAGTLTTLSSSDYIVDTYGYVNTISPLVGHSFPSVQSRKSSVIVNYTAGGSCSYSHKAGICQLALHLYENRTPLVIGTIVAKLPFTIKSLFSVNRNWRYL